MPVSTPNRVQDPVQLEQYVDPGQILQLSGLALPFYNENPNTILQGEPFTFCDYVCVSKVPILPGTWGTAYTGWVVNFLLDTALAASIVQGQLVYWDFGKNIVTPYGGGTAVSGVGAATDTVPTNGILLGRAVSEKLFNLGESSGNMLAANTDSLRVRVASSPSAATVYGTGGGSTS